MTLKTVVKTDKKGRTEEWSWEETPEFLEALAQYNKTRQERLAKGL